MRESLLDEVIREGRKKGIILDPAAPIITTIMEAIDRRLIAIEKAVNDQAKRTR